MTLCDLQGHNLSNENLRLHKVSIYTIFPPSQNRFINEYARKKKAKIPGSRSFFCEILKNMRY